MASQTLQHSKEESSSFSGTVENGGEEPIVLSGKSLAEANKKDSEITSLIQKDIDRTLQELPLF